MPERAPARQILGIIQGAGLKGEEVKWSGIGPALDRLAAEHQGKIPKAAERRWSKRKLCGQQIAAG